MEEKVKAAARLIQELKDKQEKLSGQHHKLQKENELLDAENKQVRKLLTEIDHLKEERKFVRQKCEKLLEQFGKANI